MKVLLVILILVVGYVLLANFAQRSTRDKRGDVNTPLIAKEVRVPSDWHQWEELLEKAKLPSVKVELLDSIPSSIISSKVGGKPFWPVDMDYPIDDRGKPMIFLAQINFAEIEQPLPDFPTTGLLQFFISNNELWGLDLTSRTVDERMKNASKGHRVVYHKSPNVSQQKEDLDESIYHSDTAPLAGSSGIKFSYQDDFPLPTDANFDRITQLLQPASDEVLEYAYETLVPSVNHKIGGFAVFTQEDPRTNKALAQEWQLLFQLDSDSKENIDILWGDVGIANFFIRKEDLIALKFNNVWYNWDCH